MHWRQLFHLVVNVTQSNTFSFKHYTYRQAILRNCWCIMSLVTAEVAYWYKEWTFLLLFIWLISHATSHLKRSAALLCSHTCIITCTKKQWLWFLYLLKPFMSSSTSPTKTCSFHQNTCSLTVMLDRKYNDNSRVTKPLATTNKNKPKYNNKGGK